MLYPRMTKDGLLVADDQTVDYREHMTNTHRITFLTGLIGMRCPHCGHGETDSHNLLMALDTISHEPIKMVITSPGGDLDAAFLFYDTMKFIKSPVITIGRYCASAAALLLAAGSKRYLLPHAKVMLHLPATQLIGDSHDLKIQQAQIQMYQDAIIDILIECGVKRSSEEILTDIDRTFWLEPNQAIEYGLADEILTPKVWQEWIEE